MTKWQGSVTHASEAEKAWARVRASLRESAGVRLFEQWLKPIELIPGEDRDTIRLALPSAFMTNWVRNHYADRLVLEFKQILPNVRTVQIETRAPGRAAVVLAIEPVADAIPAKPVADPLPVETKPTSKSVAEPVQATMKFGVDPSLKPAPAPVVTLAPVGVPAERPPLDPRYTFARFVVDPSNKVAFNAAKVLAEPGPVRFSPLFLHSGTGQGKTHLMHAIGHAFLEHNPHAIVLCMSAERFMYDFVASMRARDTHAFKQRLRGADLLLIDDLQFIAGKDATQEEFFHTVNEIMAAGKRLVISADRCPQALEGVEARIVSRMSVGLVADIKAPDLVLRRTILDRKLVDLPDMRVPTDVLDLLASRIHANIRELEGALNRVVAYAQLTGDTIDLDFAIATLGEVLRGAQKRVTIDEIQKLVSAHFELKPLDLISARRARAVARPRQIAMYLAKRLTTRSLPEIGRKFGGRDHSTVIHAVRKIEELRDSDRDIDAAVRVLMRELEG
ncbi:chromosomal replication initiator protein DnaA [Sphingomonas sp. PP-CC-3G-468]|uniref:chromosomal replication initiator protein DnaA n=1 Tax=Sphingomonas sp. PP-CC-3G-468 TaxID=2135656 RepID=UPI000E709E01|nr:chromosomal replication initiator protein DnaA [Sphingomonas sp. PP-CC-3G-468]RKE53449.1 chromosomal replication initiator protein DnaA [Sphingomonas sp. PP-CC-1A-547]TCM09943.1 chromosomal replication initiator protein DnaA [Sphingomonas sp. PP-CC-3G-468]